MNVAPTLSFRCQCGSTNSVPAHFAGRRGRCGACKETITVPGSRLRSPECWRCKRSVVRGESRCLRCPAPPGPLLSIALTVAAVSVGAFMAVSLGTITLAVGAEGGVVIGLLVIGTLVGGLVLLSGLADAGLLVFLLLKKGKTPMPLFSSAVVASLGLIPRGLHDAHCRIAGVTI